MIKIPDWLSKRKFSDSDNKYLKIFSEFSKIKYFSDISKEILETYAQSFINNIDSFYKLIAILGLYGVEFYGKANTYSMHLYQTPHLIDSRDKDFRSIQELNFSLKLVSFLSNLSIENTYHLNGIRNDVLYFQSEINIYDINSMLNQSKIKILEDYNEIIIFYSKKETINESNVFNSKNEINNLIINECENSKHNNIETNINEINKPTEDLSIEYLKLSTRAINALKNNNIFIIKDLIKLTDNEILKFKNSGVGVLNNIKECISESNYNLNNIETNINEINKPTEDLSIEYLKLSKRGINVLNLSKKAINVLKNNNIFIIKDLIKLTDNEILKFKHSDIDVLNNIKECISESNYNLNNIELRGVEKITEESSIEHLKLSRRASNALKNNNIFTIKDLIQLTEKNLKEFKHSGVNTIEEIKLSLEKFNFSLKSKSDISNNNETNQMDLKDLILFLFNFPILILNRIDILNRVDTFTRVDTFPGYKLYKIFHGRVIENPQVSLNIIGNELGLTRERIRQIESKILYKILGKEEFRKYMSIVDSLIKKMALMGNIIPFSHLFSNSINYLNENELNNTDLKILNYFLSKDKLYFDLKNKLIWNFSIDEIEGIFITIRKDLENFTASAPLDITLAHIKRIVIKILNDYLPKTEEEAFFTSEIIRSISNDVITRYLIKLDEKNFAFKNYSLAELAIKNFKELFPEGTHVFKNKETILSKMYEKSPQLKERNERFVEQLTNWSRNKNRILLWDTGFYIHVDNIKNKVNWSLIYSTIEKCVDYFENENIQELKINRLFTENEEELIEGGIPTLNALYSLFRVINDPRLITEEFPRVFDSRFAKENKMLKDVFSDFIKAQNTFISKEQMENHFIEKLGWKNYELEQTLNRTDDVLVWNNNDFIHKDNTNFNEEKMKELINLIEIETNKVIGKIHLDKIRSKYPVLWCEVFKHDVNIKTIGKVISNMSNISFRVEHFTSVTQKQNEKGIYLMKMVEAWSKNYGDFVTKNQLKNEFCKTRGFSDHALNMVLYNSNLLVSGKAEYVHPYVIGFSTKILDELKITIINMLNEVYSKNFIPYIKIDSILYFNNLPVLKNDFLWTSELVKTFIKKMDDEFIIFYGVLIKKDNPLFIKNIEDLIAYLLRKNFKNSRERLSVFSNYLISEEIIGSINKFNSLNYINNSPIELADDGTFIQLSKFGREKYLYCEKF